MYNPGYFANIGCAMFRLNATNEEGLENNGDLIDVSMSLIMVVLNRPCIEHFLTEPTGTGTIKVFKSFSILCMLRT